MTPAEFRQAADAIVAAGGEVAEQWGYRLTYPNGEPMTKSRWLTPTDPGARLIAESVCASPANWDPPGPPGELLRRLVVTTPAEVVTPEVA